MTRRARKTLPSRARTANTPQSNAHTRERLIAAGRELFVERGFDRVTVRDIARHARANLAAVSYHFGDKLGLYREIARQAMAAVQANSDMAITALPGASPEHRLRHYVRTYLPRVAKPGDDTQWIGKLMNHEMASPTPIASWIFSEGIVPRLMYLRGVVAELLDTDPTDARVSHCVMSIQSQCLFYRPDPFKTAVAPDWAPVDDAAVAAVAEHVVRFSLAGIKAVRRQSAKTR